jgi:hypothetical protein
LPWVLQIAPLLQFDPLQQTDPAVPHALQVPPEQVNGAAVVDVQALPLQQAAPAVPHATQFPAPLHTLLAAVHTLLAQHGCPMPPQAAQLPFPPQTAPKLQVVPQHGCLSEPHVTQVDRALHTVVELQVCVPPQQGWLFAPQATQAGVAPLVEHRNPVAQALLGQQGCPLPPQLPQVPFMHEIPLPLQVLAAQQGWPTPPHVAHVDDDVMQIVPAAVHEEPQHGCLSAPHVLHVPPEQVVPVALQTLPAQQTWLNPPQATHDPVAEQTEPPAQTLPQHGCPAAPQAAHLPLVSHVAPMLQAVPQQAWPATPHGVHWLVAEQTKFGAQFDPGQHA